jgi:hypothetical protein
LAFKRGLIRERASAGREAAKIERLLALNQRRCKRDDIRKIHEPLKGAFVMSRLGRLEPFVTSRRA